MMTRITGLACGVSAAPFVTGPALSTVFCLASDVIVFYPLRRSIGSDTRQSPLPQNSLSVPGKSEQPVRDNEQQQYCHQTTPLRKFPAGILPARLREDAPSGETVPRSLKCSPSSLQTHGSPTESVLANKGENARRNVFLVHRYQSLRKIPAYSLLI